MRRAFVLALAALLPALAAPATGARRRRRRRRGRPHPRRDRGLVGRELRRGGRDRPRAPARGEVDARGPSRLHLQRAVRGAAAVRPPRQGGGRRAPQARPARDLQGDPPRRGCVCASGRRARAQVVSRFKVTHTVRRGGRRLADQMSGTVRLSGICGERASTLTVSWAATRSDIPEAPTPGFTLGPDPVSLSADGGVVSFTDTSVDDIDGGTIVSRVWEFGDPGSGDANVAEGTQAQPSLHESRNLHRQVDGDG